MIIDKLLLLGICFFLPISLYFNYSVYTKTFEIKEHSIILEFTLIISLLLMIKYNKNPSQISIILYLLPVIVAIQKRRYLLFLFQLLVICICIKFPLRNSSILESIQTIMVFTIYVYLTIQFFRIGTNIYDLSKMEQELEKEKLLRMSISKLTHELKNPIAVCNGYLEMINLNNKEKASHYIDIITNEITRSKSIIDEFSAFGKLKELSPEELDLTLLLEDVISILKPLFNKIHGTIALTAKEDIYITADYNKLKQVFINLLKNTLEAKKDDEELKVIVTAKSYKKSISLTIKDNGIGMSKDTMSKIGNIFYTTKQNGTGIGLAFSKEVIELHHGSITIKSKINEGTTIKITLPKEKKS